MLRSQYVTITIKLSLKHTKPAYITIESQLYYEVLRHIFVLRHACKPPRVSTN